MQPDLRIARFVKEYCTDDFALPGEVQSRLIDATPA
jgi:hypothetical protein